MNKDEIILLKDALINSLLENVKLKNKLRNEEESSMLWYNKCSGLEKQLRDLKVEPELSELGMEDENPEISKEL